MGPMLFGLIAVAHAGAFQLSNTLGDHMVLQRAPASSMVHGFASPGAEVTTQFGKWTDKATTDAAGVWRQQLPATEASKIGQTITFTSSDGGKAELNDVLFGEVYLCGGQSNMAYTPRSMAGMNNMTAEIASADGAAYHDIRVFTVGQGTRSNVPLTQLKTILQNWTVASSKSIGGAAWKEFSAVCWLFGKELHDTLGVPVGLVSSNWGGTPIQSWITSAGEMKCAGQNKSGNLYNAMISPYTVGPMQFQGALWYQGESNVGQAKYYACAFPAMIEGWRTELKTPSLWFGFIQIAGFKYSGAHSVGAGDLRQSQLNALALPRVAVATTIDTGDWNNIHPPDKQTPSMRLAAAALDEVYGQKSYAAKHTPPLYAGQTIETSEGTARVVVSLSRPATTTLPPWATSTSTLGKPGSVPRNECGTGYACGYPMLYAQDAQGKEQALQATAKLIHDGAAIELTAAVPAGMCVVASSYGRASWPMTLFFSEEGVPVLPWYATLNQTAPWLTATDGASEDVTAFLIQPFGSEGPVEDETGFPAHVELIV